jgi:hypothetical protein
MESGAMKGFIDLTHFVEKDMPVWPGDQRPIITEAMTIEKDMCSLQSIHFTTHVGTHIDAPSHIIKGGIPPRPVRSTIRINEYTKRFSGLKSYFWRGSGISTRYSAMSAS